MDDIRRTHGMIKEGFRVFYDAVASLVLTSVSNRRAGSLGLPQYNQCSDCCADPKYFSVGFFVSSSHERKCRGRAANIFHRAFSTDSSEMITKLSPDVTDNSDMITMVDDISSECTMKGVLQVGFLWIRLLWWFHSLCSFKLSHTDN